MRRRRVGFLLLATLASPAWAQTPTKLVPVVEPGKPMRFAEVAAAPIPEPAAPDPCSLEQPLDRVSTPSSTCMQCHDGSRAANASVGHKYDIEYVSHGKELRPDPQRFNSRVVLPGGKVTCLSCHVPLATTAFHLAAPTGGTLDERLCTACHIR